MICLKANWVDQINFMKSLTFSLIVVFSFALAAAAQSGSPEVQAEIERQRREVLQRQIERDLDNRSAALDSLSLNRELARRGGASSLRQIKKLYRLPDDDEEELLAPEKAAASKYSDFLKNGKSGIVKLMPDLGCDDLTLQQTRSPKCDHYTIPGGGSGFSFRTGTHRQWLFADLVFDGRYFFAFGQFSQGFMAQLPGTSIDNVDLHSEGVKFVSDFVPATGSQEVSKQNLQFVDGVRQGSFLYGKLLPVTDDGTYVMRSIAYRGRIIRQHLDGTEYNELDFDKRGDVIVVFRVVGRSPDGGITILWKQLQRRDAPKM